MNESTRFSFHSRTPEETALSAQRLSEVLSPLMNSDAAFVISLIGELGAGKTHFVKGLALGLGLDPDVVTSPTFAIVNEYDSAVGPRLIHLDFYRLESEMALEEVGFLDLLALPAVLAIEWGNRFPRSLPVDHMRVEIVRGATPAEEAVRPNVSVGRTDQPGETEDKSPREFTVTATGARSQKALEAWRGAARTLAGS